MAKSKSDIEEFLKRDMTHVSASNELIALWYDGNGNWEKAHDQVDHLTSKSASRIHAYLHRKEGDSWNADYWYRKAGEKLPETSLEEEWEELVHRFLK
jgi:hypothetical protein